MNTLVARAISPALDASAEKFLHAVNCDLRNVRIAEDDSLHVLLRRMLTCMHTLQELE